MPLRLDHRRFRLLFTHPFGTAHGFRDGTDTVFVRIAQGGISGFGEATLPPYLKENADSVVAVLEHVDLGTLCLPQDFMHAMAEADRVASTAPAARAAITTALFDLMGKLTGRRVSALLGVPNSNSARAMVTLGITELDRIEERLIALPSESVLKVKLGGPQDIETLKRIKTLTNRSLFLDANQGLGTIEDALALLDVVRDRDVLGIEQPFAADRWDLHATLMRRTSVTIYADESIQGPGDMARAAEAFGGVNLKLMKCGGLDVAEQMAGLAQAAGLKVMLGTMSESSLGCTAMGHLIGRAELADLDGPWLLKNDPLEGLKYAHGRVVMPEDPGIGVRWKALSNADSFCI